MYVYLAWLSVFLITVMLMPYLLKKLGKPFLRHDGYKKVLKGFRAVHKPLGLLIILVGGTHGFLALGGTLRLNTNGTVLWIILMITATFGGLYFRLRKKELFIIHKFMALVVVVAFFYHYIQPGPIF